MGVTCILQALPSLTLLYCVGAELADVSKNSGQHFRLMREIDGELQL
jgi:hypothetical protein